MRGREIGILLVKAAFYLVFCLTSASSEAALFSETLMNAVLKAGPDEPIEVILVFPEKREIDRIKGIGSKKASKDIIMSLRRNFSSSFKAIEGRLVEANRVKSIKPLWIINGVVVTVEAGFLAEMIKWPDIEEIRLDEVIYAPSIELGHPVQSAWNIEAVRAPELWALGIRGSGIVVASLDSGVDYLHQSLASTWRGGNNSWFDPYGEHSNPFDYSGHGSAVMGIMVGGSLGGYDIGVSPESRWIAVKIFRDAGYASESAIHMGFQFILDPDGNPETDDAPHVVNNSWGFGQAPGSCIEYFRPDIEALRAAGISVVAAAGNAGPLAATSVSPANYPNVFSVGSVDITGAIAPSSSRGPSACDGSEFPDLVAPGVSITSAALTNNGLLPFSSAVWSGTSFASPHVAGAIALLMSAFPMLTAQEIEQALFEEAWDLGVEGPDNEYGNGLLDVMQAYVSTTYRMSIHGYYEAILDRAPDSGGATYWLNTIKALSDLCVDRREGLGGLAQALFRSEEYQFKDKNDKDYVTDLYEGFLRRTPSDEEVDYWVDQVRNLESRNAVLLSFLYSDEFYFILNRLLGSTTAREECNIVSDFYRGFLNRFPDEEGFVFWRGLIREAQCVGPAAVAETCRNLARLFVESDEYLARARNNREYIEDLYNALMRRGPDLAGLTFWVEILERSALSRGEVLDLFLGSLEFSTRMDRISSAGCLH